MDAQNTSANFPRISHPINLDTSSTPLMLRTSLIERIVVVNGSRELLPITQLPLYLPLSLQTIRNQLSGGKTAIGVGGGSAGLEVIRFNARVYVRTEDLIRLIWNSAPGTIRKKSGRKSNRQRAEEKSSDSTAGSPA